MGTHRSIAIAISVNTDAPILKIATNCEILQYNVPNGQCEFNMYVKLNVTFKVDTIASAIDKLTGSNLDG